LIIGTGTKSDGTLKILVDTLSKDDHQNAPRPLNKGGTGKTALPVGIPMLTRGTLLLQTTNQYWTIVPGNPHPPGNPLGPGSAKIIVIKMDLAATTTTNLLLLDAVELAATITLLIEITTTPRASRNEIGEMTMGMLTSVLCRSLRHFISNLLQ
jgi:hypothetical protein